MSHEVEPNKSPLFYTLGTGGLVTTAVAAPLFHLSMLWFLFLALSSVVLTTWYFIGRAPSTSPDTLPWGKPESYRGDAQVSAYVSHLGERERQRKIDKRFQAGNQTLEDAQRAYLATPPESDRSFIDYLNKPGLLTMLEDEQATQRFLSWLKDEGKIGQDIYPRVQAQYERYTQLQSTGVGGIVRCPIIMNHAGSAEVDYFYIKNHLLNPPVLENSSQTPIQPTCPLTNTTLSLETLDAYRGSPSTKAIQLEYAQFLQDLHQHHAEHYMQFSSQNSSNLESASLSGS